MNQRLNKKGSKRRIGLFLMLLFVVPIILCFSAKPIFSQTVYEAEDGTLTGTTISTSRPGYSGTGYVTGFDADGDAVAVDVNVPSAGTYNLMIRYASEFGDKTNDLYVNGSNQGGKVFPQTNTFQDTSVEKIQLEAGINEIKIVKSWGWFDVDSFTIESATLPPLDVPNTLVNPNASNEAKALMTYLTDHYGEQILSGQQNWEDADWVYSNFGKKPAVVGFDFMDYSPSRVEFGASSDEAERAITWAQSGSMVTICWHWNAPKDLINEPGNEWWRGFYTNATTFDVEYAMNNPTSEDYQLILRDIDAIAVQLEKLQVAGVPVLWRPLHEAEGGWFWWGAKGPEPCKQLWWLMYDRCTDYHGLNNLIWVWTSSDSSSAMDWYPGDQYIDIISADIYLDAGDYSPCTNTFYNLVEMYGGEKLVTLSETGTIPDPDELVAQKVGWSWFCVWGGDFIRDGITNTTEHLNHVYNHSYVITLAPNFSISVSPTSGSVVQGESTTATVPVSPIEGFSDTVSLSATSLPSGATASFAPSSGTPSFSSTLTISTASTTPTGTYSITITGTDGGDTHSCTYTLTVTSAPAPEPFPWPLTIGIIVAVVIIIAAVIVIYRRH